MKSTTETHSRRVRFSFWTIFLGGLAAVAAASWSSADFHAGAQTPPRKSTDPPIAASGKLGQDLFLAIDHRDLAAVQALLAKGADPNARNGLEFTPLHVAAASHQKDVMEALLHDGAKPD